MALTANFYLSLGDGATADYLNLNDASGAYTVAWWDQGDPDAGRVQGGRRMVAVGLNVEGASITAAWDSVRAVEDKLRQARLGARTTGQASGVTLGVQIGSGSSMVYFDVLDGRINLPQNAFSMSMEQGAIEFSGVGSGAVLQLECLPYARGDSVTLSAATINEAGLFTQYQASIPGDVPALAHFEITDQSTNSHFLNRLRVAHKSQQDLDSGDWDGIVDCDAAGSATLQTVQADSIGSDFSRLASGSVTVGSWNTVGSATGPTPAADNAGVVDIFARVRDHTASVTPPTNLALRGKNTTGSLPAGTYKYRVVALISGGNSAGSNEITVSVSAPDDLVTLEWVAPTTGTVTGYRVYWKRDTNAWKYLNTGSTALIYNHSTESGATTADPPTSPTGGDTADWRVQVGLSSGTTLVNYPPVPSNLASSNWEVLKLGSAVHLPPAVLVEGGSSEQWFVNVQANSGTAVNLDVDCLFILPTAATWKAEYSGLALATLREWNVAQRRDGSRHGVLRNTGTNAEAGQVSVVGPVLIGPGDTQIQYLGEIEDGVHSVDDLVLSSVIHYVPRFKTIRGTS